MLDSRERKKIIADFIAGLPPKPKLAECLLVGLDRLLAEWKRDLETYIRPGGSMLRIVVGASGSGKTHLGEAVKAVAAERGFLLCKIDTQAQQTNTDDLLLYRAFCQGMTCPRAYLDSGADAGAKGVVAVLETVAAEMDASAVRAALRSVPMPTPLLKDALAAVVDAIRTGRLGSAAERVDPGWAAMAAALSGEKPYGIGSLTRLRARFGPEPFRSLPRLPGKRDARLWLESLLLATRPLGFSGAVLVLDEHDDAQKKSLDLSIVQLRHQLDQLAGGHLPGTFVLFLVLDDFPNRVNEAHAALEQRIRPLVSGTLRSRLMCELPHLRDLQGAPFLEAVAARLHALVSEGPMPPNLVAAAKKLAHDHTRLEGPNTRGFVQAFAHHLDEV